MRISAKGRYALTSVIHMAREFSKGECITVISIAEKLGISKIYLEHVFSLLKRGDVVFSVKGSQGGYVLTRPPRGISVYDVLSAVETSMFEATEATVEPKAPEIDAAMGSLVFNALDAAVKAFLEQITLEDLIQEIEKENAKQGLMFYI